MSSELIPTNALLRVQIYLFKRKTVFFPIKPMERESTTSCRLPMQQEKKEEDFASEIQETKNSSSFAKQKCDNGSFLSLQGTLGGDGRKSLIPFRLGETSMHVQTVLNDVATRFHWCKMQTLIT